MARSRRIPAARAAAPDASPPETAQPWKARTALASVALVALWPLCHRALVAWLDVNPWKLGGFAMYTTATPPLLIGLFSERDGRLGLIEPSTLPLDAQRLLERFERERHALGDLRSPDDVAQRVLAARPDVERLVVVVQRMALDPQSARMTAHKRSYTYAR
ncbi:MAG TPA: hypothetical protein VIS07_21855 [Candidatus Binatia bacterium]